MSEFRRRLMMQGKIAYTYEDAAYIYNENGGYIDTGFMANQDSRIIPESGHRYTLELNKNAYNLGGLGSGTLTAGTFQLTVPLHLFHATGRAQNNTRYRLYSCQIYDNGTLARDFVPKLRSDGKYGLWDKVEEKFYLSPNNIDFVGALTE